MKRFALGLTALILAVGPASAQQPAAPTPAPQAAPLAKAQVIALAERVADYQLASMVAGVVPGAMRAVPDPKGWIQGAFYVGLSKLADYSASPRYGQVVLLRGEVNKWELGARPYHADDHVIGQSYLWAARHGAGEAAIAPTRKSLDAILAAPSSVDLAHAEYDAPGGVTCDKRWCWSDALFMAPPVWFEMTRATGDQKYATFAKSEFLAVTDYLFDKTDHLYYRDSRFFPRRGPDGEKMFWSRGNGWAYAGLALVIAQMPEGDPDKAKFVQVFRQMSVKLKAIQKADGYWSPSLLSDPAKALPETSGTGFFVYGMAWGVKAGILDRATYEPSIRKGWSALTRAVHPNGKLGWVQLVSDQPNVVDYDDTHYYGVGAFLLAATAVSDLGLQ